MPVYSVNTTVAAPPAEVFPLVADLTRHGEWSADPLEITRVEGDGDVGTRYASTSRSKGKTITAEIVVTEHVPNQAFGFKVTDLTGSYAHTFTFEPEGGGTLVTRRIETSALSVPQLLLFWLVYPTVKRPNARRAMDNLSLAAGRQARDS